ncbi:MAG: hypothetical protein FWH10_00240 [Oscillospiraceae bacterium]|nr:hypothetical protein [Oscillospiraceae bacterium]
MANDDLMQGLQVLRNRGNSGDVDAMKRLVMIFTGIMEQATNARDYSAAISARDEGQYWLDKLEKAGIR